jgi:hypothetical protein
MRKSTVPVLLSLSAAALCLAASAGCESSGKSDGPLGGIFGPGSATWWDRTWARIKGKSAGDALNDLQSPEADIRREGLAVLATDASTASRTDVHKLLSGYAFNPSEDQLVRLTALAGLRINAAELTADDKAKLRGLLDRPNFKWLRQEAAECLGLWVHPEAAERLVAAFREDPDPDVRMAAARSLGRYPEMTVAKALAERVKLDDRDRFEISHEARLSLIQLTGKTDPGHDPAAWLKYLNDNPAHAFDDKDKIAVRDPSQQAGYDAIDLTLGRIPYLLRKPERTEE